MTQITEWLITSSTLIVLVLLLRTLFAGKVKWKGIYMLWALVAVRLLLPVNPITSPISIMNLFSSLQRAANETETEYDTVVPTVESEENVLTDDISVITKSETRNRKEDQVSDTISDANTHTAPKSSIQEPGKTGTPLSRTSILFIVWTLGFVSVLLIFSICNIILHRRLAQNSKYAGAFKGLRVYSSQVFQIPCLYGLFRPTIYLPESLIKRIPDVEQNNASETDIHAQQLNQILTHEWVHYRQGDSFWSALRIFLLAAYWFHPLVWAAAICSKKDAELACDEKVMQLLGEQERVSYGTMLIDMAANTGNRMALYLTTPVSRQGRNLKQRIRALEKRHYSKVLSCTLIISVLLMTGTTFTGCISDAGSQGAKSTPASLKNTENKADASQVDWENLYSDFLKEHQNEKKCSYYAVIRLGDTSCPVLLTTDKTAEKKYLAGHSPALVTNTGHLYSIIDKKVTYLGDITCENNDEWLRCSDGKLMSTSPDRVSKQWVEAGEKEIQTETLKNGPDSIGRGGAAGTPANSVNNTSDEEENISATSSDTSLSSTYYVFDGETETPASSEETPQTKGKIYGYPSNISSYEGEPETPATPTDVISDKKDSDTEVIFGHPSGDDFWSWRDNFEKSDSVIFYRNTGNAMTEFASQNYLMNILTVNSIDLNIDITGDDVKDTISIDIDAAKGNYQTDDENSIPPAIQIISGKTDKVIWKSDANASLHAGYNQFYLYHKKDTYLMEWNPACWQGYCSYQWKVFQFTDNGKVKKIAGNKVEFDTNEGRVKEKDFDKIEAFGKELNTYLADAELLLDTVPEERLGIPEDGTSDNPIRVFGDEQKGQSYFDYEAVIRELKATLNK